MTEINDPDYQPAAAMAAALKLGCGTGEDLRFVAAFLENLTRGTTAEPAARALRALAQAHDTADPVDPARFEAAYAAFGEYLASDVALSLLGGPDHDAGIAWLTGTWTPEAGS